jgi:hypothetical protein
MVKMKSRENERENEVFKGRIADLTTRVEELMRESEQWVTEESARSTPSSGSWKGSRSTTCEDRYRTEKERSS